MSCYSGFGWATQIWAFCYFQGLKMNPIVVNFWSQIRKDLKKGCFHKRVYCCVILNINISLTISLYLGKITKNYLLYTTFCKKTLYSIFFYKKNTLCNSSVCKTLPLGKKRLLNVKWTFGQTCGCHVMLLNEPFPPYFF